MFIVFGMYEYEKQNPSKIALFYINYAYSVAFVICTSCQCRYVMQDVSPTTYMLLTGDYRIGKYVQSTYSIKKPNNQMSLIREYLKKIIAYFSAT